MRRGAVWAVTLLLAACSGTADPGTSAGEGAPATTAEVMTPDTTPPNSGTSQASGWASCWASPPADGAEAVSFSDQTQALGLVEPLIGMHGHAAVWADIDGDDRAELFMGTFAHRDPENYRFRGATGPSPDRLLVPVDSGYALSETFPDMYTRSSGGVVADLDNDGDLDLVLSRNYDEDLPQAPPTQILRNDGGALTPVADSGLPAVLGGRTIGVFDYDDDGLLDLFIAEDRFSGGNSVLMHNLGGLAFEDAGAAAGIPTGVHGLGVSVADLTGDGWADIFVSGSNRLFVATGSGSFVEADGSVFRWDYYGNEDDVAGSAVADVNRDGLLDLLVGQHFNSTVDDGVRVPVRLYLNRGTDASGMPMFEDVTEAAGLVGLPTKAPHVDIADIDNDGWPDLVTTASADDGRGPAVFMHGGLEGDVPLFVTPEGLGQPQYWIGGPALDYDKDGRLDLFLVEWEPALPSLLMRNETASGHWLEVSAGAEASFGVGWRVELYEAGGLGEPTSLLGAREITVSQGYSTGLAPIAHFGLGEVDLVDIRMTPPNGAEAIDLTGVPVDQHVRVPTGC